MANSGRPRIVHCRDCGRHVSVCGKLSRQRLCGDCGEWRNVSNALSLARKSGPEYERYRQRVAQAYGFTIPDE